MVVRPSGVDVVMMSLLLLILFLLLFLVILLLLMLLLIMVRPLWVYFGKGPAALVMMLSWLC